MAAASEPILCANGCGFYGSAQTNNLCSKCYKDSQNQKSQEPTTSCLLPAAASTDVVLALPAAAASAAKPSSPDSGSAEAASDCSGNVNSTGKIRPRCKACNKKVGLLGFKCRCGDVFCGSHRYAEEHGCSFDVKAMGREILVKQNPLCKGDKLEFRI